jgi:hypothetical protein
VVGRVSAATVGKAGKVAVKAAAGIGRAAGAKTRPIVVAAGKATAGAVATVAARATPL